MQRVKRVRELTAEIVSKTETQRKIKEELTTELNRLTEELAE